MLKTTIKEYYFCSEVMVFRIIICVLFATLFYNSFGQNEINKNNYFASNIEIGSSLTYIWDLGDLPRGYYRYDEYSWNLNMQMRITKRFWIGVQGIPVFTKIKKLGKTKKENYTFIGLIGQYEILQSKDWKFYVETSLNKSDMFFSLNADPTKMKGLNYIGAGAGVKYLLPYKNNNNLFLEFAFFNYSILNKIENKSNYTQYIIGVNYRIGKKWSS